MITAGTIENFFMFQGIQWNNKKKKDQKRYKIWSLKQKKILEINFKVFCMENCKEFEDFSNIVLKFRKNSSL